MYVLKGPQDTGVWFGIWWGLRYVTNSWILKMPLP